ncbi:hypothetical protein [Sphaerimonospora mesophila]|uniref:hypothetical protein n=1 Tax=Sphaerimonospora mesophila TaxID=37483 RepID=UPI0006E436CF
MSEIPRNPAAPPRWACLIAGAAVLVAGGALCVSVSRPAPAAAAVHAPGAASAVEVGPIPEADLYDVRNKEDVVTAVFTPIPQADQIQFVLHTVPGVTWWKEIRLVDGSRNTLADQADFTQDAKHHTKILTVDRSAVQKGVFLIYAKAKEWGAHTDRYEGKVPVAHLGHRIDITWQKDT